jgi:hypothetical protein
MNSLTSQEETMQDASLPSGSEHIEQGSPRSSLRATGRSELPRRLLADVLWEAANTYLSWTYRDQPGTDCFSCNAVGLTFGGGKRFVLNRAAESFLLSLGCNPDTSLQLTAISGFENGDDRLQGVRYMWLLLAMHVAEDEGIEL